ncbi:MAG: tetratricopeptide repeat protein [Desulfobacterales bacterium]|nr:tetratricopeptide repeat protein [Desulfobacterales bacterium]
MKPAAQTVASRRATLLALGLVVVVAAGLYVNTLGNDFTNWDDVMIYSNYRIRNLDGDALKKIFTYWRGSTYQPVRELSYAIDFYFWKLNPLGYHITNILFYALTCIMVFLTLGEISRHLREGVEAASHFRVALCGALLFAAHPVHVEAVTWLAARKEVLQGFFFFSAFYLYLKWREKEGKQTALYLGLVLLSILLATLSKPSAIVFPAVLLVYEIARNRETWMAFVKKRWFFFACSVGLSVLFVVILIQVMIDAGGIKPYRGGSLFNNFLVSFYAFLYNIKLLAFTVNYSASYTIDLPQPFLGPRTLAVLFITLLLFAVSLWSLRRNKIFFFAFFFFVVTVLPFLNLIPSSTILADRYVFIASFSYCFVLGVGFDKFYTLQKRGFSEGFFKLLSVALLVILLAGYAFMTMRQNRIWENSYTLWADAVEKYPDSNTANALLGVVYLELGMDREAIERLEKAVQILPYDYQSRNNLGIVYGRAGEPEKALREFLLAIYLRPDDDSIRSNLSVFYQKQGNYGQAEEILRNLLSKHPQDAYLHFSLGALYKTMGRYEAAIAELLKSSELAPQIITPYEEVGNIYVSKLYDVKKATFYYSKALAMTQKGSPRSEELRSLIQDLEAHR